jgi:hypothetical protein
MCQNHCCCCCTCSERHCAHGSTSISVPCKVVVSTSQGSGAMVSEAVQTDAKVSSTAQTRTAFTLDPNHVCIRCCRPAGVYVENWDQHPACDPAYPYPEWWPKYDANTEKQCPKPRRRSLMLPRDETLYREAFQLLSRSKASSEGGAAPTVSATAPSRPLTVVPPQSKPAPPPVAPANGESKEESDPPSHHLPKSKQTVRIVPGTESTPAKVVIGKVASRNSSASKRFGSVSLHVIHSSQWIALF